jgi:hypothetical protein
VDFPLNPRLTVARGQVGAERQPVVIIDDVLRDPAELIDFAAQETEFEPAWTPAGGYPGLRSTLPIDYASNLVRALSPMIEDVFALGDRKPGRVDCYLSMVTRLPDILTPLQRIPHIDTVDPFRIAILHYLCDERFGGTAFFRHRATGFETISAARETTYLLTRDRELAAQAPPVGYIRGDAPNYEQIEAIQCKVNRVIIYRSQLLHCAAIPPGMSFSDDPARGRLTANVFVNYCATE